MEDSNQVESLSSQGSNVRSEMEVGEWTLSHSGQERKLKSGTIYNMITSRQLQKFTHSVHNEDRLVLLLEHNKYILIGVADGHGGVTAADYCSQNFPRIFLESSRENLSERLREVFRELQDDLVDETSGTTLSIFCIERSTLQFASGFIGDSPIVFYGKQGGYLASKPHNIRSNQNEAANIQGSGAKIENGYVRDDVNRGLQVSRSIGDASFGNILSREPEIFAGNLVEYRAIVVASDGYISSVDDIEDLADVIDEGEPAFLKWSEARQYKDDASAVVLYLQV